MSEPHGTAAPLDGRHQKRGERVDSALVALVRDNAESILLFENSPQLAFENSQFVLLFVLLLCVLLLSYSQTKTHLSQASHYREGADADIGEPERAAQIHA